MLRHNDATFDEPTKRKFHAFLAAKLQEDAPTAAEEAIDPNAADSFYQRGGTWIRENTRDQTHFGLLFSENVTYGFRRNVYGLRIPALILNGVIVVGCGLAYSFQLPEKYSFNLSPVFLIAVLHAAYLTFACNEQSVRSASRIYARQLLLSTNSPKLAEKKPKEKKEKPASEPEPTKTARVPKKSK